MFKMKRMLKSAIKFFLSILVANQVKNRLKRFNSTAEQFNAELFRDNIVDFIYSNQINQKHFLYLYSFNCTKPTLYASSYALMTLGLLGEIKKLSESKKEEWRQYFDFYQNGDDGLFYDPAVHNIIFDNSDWWGARHLALHMISAYTHLDYRPKHQFKFLEKYYQPKAIQNWLDQYDWDTDSIGQMDADNKIMNIGCLLQYQRDFWNDIEAGKAVDFLKKYLRERINKTTGMWGNFNFNDNFQRSRMIQFAYHLFQIFFYDNDYNFDSQKIVKIALLTKNKVYGFGPNINSSACEDIDSIDIMIRLHKNLPPEMKFEVKDTITKAFNWVLLNQVKDGGFVFKLEEPFRYGSNETMSKKNVGAMMPTWFRTLSIVYMAKFLKIENQFLITNCPGYEFK